MCKCVSWREAGGTRGCRRSFAPPSPKAMVNPGETQSLGRLSGESQGAGRLNFALGGLLRGVRGLSCPRESPKMIIKKKKKKVVLNRFKITPTTYGQDLKIKVQQTPVNPPLKVLETLPGAPSHAIP